jgi:hypothetical protein
VTIEEIRFGTESQGTGNVLNDACRLCLVLYFEIGQSGPL